MGNKKTTLYGVIFIKNGDRMLSTVSEWLDWCCLTANLAPQLTSEVNCSTILVWQVSWIVIQIRTLECLQETVCMYKKYSYLHLNFAQPLEMGFTLRSTLCLLKQAELLLEKKKTYEFATKMGSNPNISLKLVSLEKFRKFGLRSSPSASERFFPNIEVPFVLSCLIEIGVMTLATACRGRVQGEGWMQASSI